MSKFIINRDSDNEFIITIKQNGSTLPMAITGGDTFSATLVKLVDGTTAATFTVTVHDAPSGKIKLVLLQAAASVLEVARGDKADLYYSKPRYRLKIDCNTANNGNFIAKVEKVYVE